MGEYENCKILLVDKKISNAREMVGILEGAIRGGYPLMIMAEDIEQEPLATLVLNKLRGALKVQLSGMLPPHVQVVPLLAPDGLHSACQVPLVFHPDCIFVHCMSASLFLAPVLRPQARRVHWDLPPHLHTLLLGPKVLC